MMIVMEQECRVVKLAVDRVRFFLIFDVMMFVEMITNILELTKNNLTTL